MSVNLFAGRLPWSVTDADLKTAFEAYGEVVSVKVITDHQIGKSRGFAFIEMKNEDEANSAMESLNGSKLKGRNIIVNPAKAKVKEVAG